MAWDDAPPTKAELSISKIPWDAEPPPPKESGILPTIVDKLAQGGSLGLADEASGGMEALGQAAGVQGLGGKIKDIKLSDHGPTLDWEVLKHAYINARNKDRDTLAKESSDHPILSGGTEFAGSMLNPLSKVVSGANPLVQAGALGGAMGFGNSEADSLGGVAKDTALGAGIGAGAGALVDKVVAPVINKGLGFVGDKLGDFAERRAFKALGPYQRDARKAFSKDQVNQIGRTVLDEGVFDGAPASYEGIADRANSALEKKGQDLGNYLKNLGNSEQEFLSQGQSIPGFKAGIDRQAIADKMRKDLINPNSDIPGVVQKNDQIEQLIKQFEGGDDKYLSLLKAEDLKKSVNSQIKWDRLPGADIPIEEQVNRSLSNKLKTGVEDYADVLDKTVNGPSAQGFKDLKGAFGDLSTAADISANRAARDSANRMMSPSDYATGLAGLGGAVSAVMTGHPGMAIAGLGMGLANNLGRKYGNQVMAKGADSVSKVLLNSPKMLELSQSNPAAFQSIVSAMEKRLGMGSASTALQGADGSEPPQSPQASKTLDMIRKNPELIDQVNDPDLKNKIKSQLNQEKDPRESFIQGN